MGKLRYVVVTDNGVRVVVSFNHHIQYSTTLASAVGLAVNGIVSSVLCIRSTLLYADFP
jgi:hypothetical protein